MGDLVEGECEKLDCYQWQKRLVTSALPCDGLSLPYAREMPEQYTWLKTNHRNTFIRLLFNITDDRQP